MLGAAIFAVNCSTVRGHFQPTTAAAHDSTAAAGIPGYARSEDDTFLTYPEWYIVWSYQEKADFQESHLPSGFPYFAAIGQYWRGYCCMYSIVRTRYPFNFGDHLMLVVIGSSFTVEYALKGLYEKTVGRVSEWSSNHEPVDEDRYAYQVARQYADFVHIRPFYEFPFFQSLQGLWRQTTMWGTHPIRKWERKAWLSLDYGVEAIYCGLIELASHAVYGVEAAETYAWIEHAPQTIFADFPHIRKVKQIGTDSFVVVIPRYQEFTELAMELAKRNVQFTEIAGNRQILLSVIAPGAWQPEGGVEREEVLLATDILTRPGMKRLLIVSPVSDLATALNRFAGAGVTVEHIYDF